MREMVGSDRCRRPGLRNKGFYRFDDSERSPGDNGRVWPQVPLEYCCEVRIARKHIHIGDIEGM